MLLLSKRSVLGIAAVVDIALHARNGAVAAKALASRHNLPPRHLETLLQSLVRSGILKGMRGPRGGYELARERRRISVADIVRSAMSSEHDGDGEEAPGSPLISAVIEPALHEAGLKFLAQLDSVTVEDLCRETEAKAVFSADLPEAADFAI